MKALFVITCVSFFCVIAVSCDPHKISRIEIGKTYFGEGDKIMRVYAVSDENQDEFTVECAPTEKFPSNIETVKKKAISSFLESILNLDVNFNEFEARPTYEFDANKKKSYQCTGDKVPKPFKVVTYDIEVKNIRGETVHFYYSQTYLDGDLVHFKDLGKMTIETKVEEETKPESS